MDENNSQEHSRNQRISEVKRALFHLNDGLRARLMELRNAEFRLLRDVSEVKISLDPKKVPAHRLANRIFARSMRLDVRMNQRNSLYFKMRRSQLAAELERLGLSLEDVDAEWAESTRQRLAEARESAGSTQASEEESPEGSEAATADPFEAAQAAAADEDPFEAAQAAAADEDPFEAAQAAASEEES